MISISERRKRILNCINSEGMVKVDDMSKVFNVSSITIRKDLNYLENKGLITREHGKAVPYAQNSLDINVNSKKLINYDAKRKIAAKANSFINENDSILIASGSTIAVFAETLQPKKRLNVVSISVNISAHLGDIPGVTVQQVGGILYGNTLSVLGAEASNTIENLYCSKVFFGVDGIDLEYGVTCATGEEASITQKMMKSAKTTIVLTDSTKLGRRGFARICDISDIDVLITDGNMPIEAQQRIESLGVKLIVCK